MRTTLAALLLLSGQCMAHSSLELMCGINKVSVDSEQGLVIDGVRSDYITSKMDGKGFVYYQFANDNQIRSTQKGRVSLKTKTIGWQSCYPIIYYKEK